MGKKKATKKKGSHTEDDEAGSIASATTLSSLQELGYDDVVDDDPFESSIDALYEKRATTREKGLQTLVRLLAASYCYEEAVVRKDTLCTLLLGCIKRGGALEATLACRGIALLLMTLGAGDDAESIQQEAQPVFEQAACHGKAATVKAAAIEALAITAFVASDDPGVVDKCMTGFANLWKAGPTKVSEAAIRGWALLLSTVPTHRMTSSSIEASLQSLSKLLHSNDVEVRATAGEAIALLYHSCGLSNLEAFLESEQNDLEPGSPTDSDGAVDYYNDLVTQPASATQHPAVPNSHNAQSTSGIHMSTLSPQHLTTSASRGIDSSHFISQGSAEQHVDSDTANAANHMDAANAHLQDAGNEVSQCSHSHARVSHSDPDDRLQNGSVSGHDFSGPQTQSASPDQQAQATVSGLGDTAVPAAGLQCPEQHSPPNCDRNGDASVPNAQPIDPQTDPLVPGSNPIECTEHQTSSSSNHSDCNKPPVSSNSHASGNSQRASKLAGKSPRQAAQPPRKNPRNQKQQAEAISSGLDDVVGRMKELAMNKGDKTRRSRKDRASLRSTFRELCNVVEQGGNVGQTRIKLRHGDSLIIDTLSGTVQLNAIRRFLAEGFQIHLQQNPLLHQIFGFQPRGERAERLTPLEKRLYRSPASAENKSRTQQRNHDRAATSAYKGAMMAEGW